MGERSLSEYEEASDEQLVAWANDGDERAFDLATILIIPADDPVRGLRIVNGLSPAVLERASVRSLEWVARVYDKLGRNRDALRWWTAASDKGSISAPFYAGVIHEDAEDKLEAFKWYMLAAERGDPEGQYMTANYLVTGKGGVKDPQEAFRYMKLAADKGMRQANEELDSYRLLAQPSGGCIIATACLGDGRVAALRKVRDDAIASDPVARDFFHVFWSRYYEWSPPVARLAAADPAVAEHIRWGFLDPWLAWLEFATAVGRGGVSSLGDEERRRVLERLDERLRTWIGELPALFEDKRREYPGEVFAAFERLREPARCALSGMLAGAPVRGSPLSTATEQAGD